MVKISIIQGVYISFLTEEEQTWVVDTLVKKIANINNDKAELLKEYSKEGIFTKKKVKECLFYKHNIFSLYIGVYH